MASIIKADNIQKVSDGSNIIKKCGSTITVGSSGQTVALASGASQTGFGTPTSSVLWCTTAKTSPFTAADQKGYFVNTSGGAVTVTLPSSPTAGDVIAIKDYADTFDTNNLTICRGGSKISGTAINPVLNTEGESIKLIFVDATQGWLNVQTDDTVKGSPNFIVATGGTISTSGDFKIHTFNSTSSFAITTAPTPANNNVSYMVVAGGGGGGGTRGSGAGAGGFREGKTPATPYTASPLVAPAGLPVAASTSYPVTVGAGGGVQPNQQVGIKGSDSVFSSITSGGGGYGADDDKVGGPGGSGGGGGGGGSYAAGTGNVPPVSPSQGNPGGASGADGRGNQGGGGGGAGAAGNPNVPSPAGGVGGAGVTSEINASPVARAGGGGAGGTPGVACGSVGGTGGGGRGAPRAAGNAPTTAGTANTGGGGGGAGESPCGNNNVAGIGGSGVVIIRYKFQ